ncbi:FAD-dependent oxidoreductase [uncultured Umboniibacter sp.]|uniref:FAD-dependent oxidoreductase n=1 Tax=uncultured Umboniibacter sp. TaxID=1798917 RepID=UPI002612181F|nr:FAD-dependent oxidoreductase [uncultured Umboniibacter sp.]
MSNQDAPLVIIGTGLAAYNLAREWRKRDSSTPLIMLTQDSGRSYSKPMLSTAFSKDKTAEGLTMADAGKMAEQLSATIHTFVSVDAIDTHKRVLSFDGTQLNYRDLVIAAGSETINLPIENTAQSKTFAVNDLEQFAEFQEAAKTAQRILIIGGGLIGCEYANDLLTTGAKISLVELQPTLLSNLCHEAIGNALVSQFTEEGIDLHLSTAVTAIREDKDGVVATLNNGTELAADIVLSAVGVRARTQLARQSGLACERGIQVDRELRSSVKHVYALGDCAEVDGHLLYYVMPLMQCVRALAQTLSGTPTAVSYPAMPVTIKTSRFPIVTNPPDTTPETPVHWQVEHVEGGVKALAYNVSGALIGFSLGGSSISEKASLAKSLPKVMA